MAAKKNPQVPVISSEGLREKQAAQQSSMFSTPVPLAELPKTRLEVEKVPPVKQKLDPAPNATKETVIEKHLPVEKPQVERKSKPDEYDWTQDKSVSFSTKCPPEKQLIRKGAYYEVAVPIEQISIICPNCGKDAANIKAAQFNGVKLIPYMDELTKQMVVPRPIFTLLAYAATSRCEHCGKAYNTCQDFTDIVIIEQAGIRNPYPYAARQVWLKEVTDQAITSRIPVLSGERYGI